MVHYQLPNGLDVVLERDDRQPRVAVVVGYDVGWRDDPPGLDGLAHMVEHLSFRSTRHLPRPFEAGQLLRRAGGTEINGFTGPDDTSYQEVVPADALPLALFVESERMAFSLERFSSKAIELEKNIIWREGALLHRSPEDQFTQDSVNAFFGTWHPYARDDDGAEQLNHADLPSTQAFFQQTYRPDNAHLILVGDFELEPTRALVEQYFGPIVASTVPRRPATNTTVTTHARSFVRRSFARFDELSVTWPAPDPQSDAGVASKLLALQLLAKLQDALVRDQKLASKVSADLCPLELGPMLRFTIATEDDVDKVLPVFEAELSTLWRTDWAHRLPPLRRELVLSEQLRRASLIDVARDHLESARRTHQPYDFRAHLTQLERVSPARMQALSQLYKTDQAMLGWLLRVGGSSARLNVTGIEVVPR